MFFSVGIRQFDIDAVKPRFEQYLAGNWWPMQNMGHAPGGSLIRMDAGIGLNPERLRYLGGPPPLRSVDNRTVHPFNVPVPYIPP